MIFKAKLEVIFSLTFDLKFLICSADNNFYVIVKVSMKPRLQDNFRLHCSNCCQILIAQIKRLKFYIITLKFVKNDSLPLVKQITSNNAAATNAKKSGLIYSHNNSSQGINEFLDKGYKNTHCRR